MRYRVLRLLLAMGIVLAAAGEAERPIVLRASPVALHDEDPEIREIGRLRYRAGFHLTSDAGEHGGFSGLVIDPEGRLLAVSDRGHWLSAEARFAVDGTLAGFEDGRLGSLSDHDGKPVEGKERRDAEELVALPGRGHLVSFEGDHRLVLYPQAVDGSPFLLPPEAFSFPGGIHESDRNKGMEAVALLSDGRLLAVSEELRTGGGDVAGWIGAAGSLAWERLTLRTVEDYLPTGAAVLPSGEVLVVERSYREETDLTRVRLSLLEVSEIRPGARLAGVEIALLEPPLTVDNIEAVAAHAGPGGETLIYLLSDDNFSEDQRTLLMQFELLAPQPLADPAP